MKRSRVFQSLVAVLVVLVMTGGTAWSAVTGRYDLAVIRVKYSDTTPLYTMDELRAGAVEMHDYFAQLSQGQLDLQVQVVEVTLPNPWSFYHSACSNCDQVGDAAEAAAAAGFDFTGIEGILIARSGCVDDWAGFTTLPAVISRPGVSGTFQHSVDIECEYGDTPSRVKWGPWAHEIGHQFETFENRWAWTHPTGYSSGYNLMDSCYPCGESAWSLVEQSLSDETGIAHKLVFPGWIPASRMRVVNPVTSPGETVVLSPISDDLSQTTAPHGIKIPIASGQYYFLEARRKTRADGWRRSATLPAIYDEGVQIIRFNESADTVGVVIDSCDTLVPGGCVRGSDEVRCPGGSITPTTHPACWPYPLWKTGNTFDDTVNGISIRIGPEVGNGYTVTVMRIAGSGAPDMFATPWLTPPMNTYETIDIWVDSSCNGYEDAGGALRHGRRADTTVIGNGDYPCANHENRVFARVRNIGTSPANDVRVRFDVTDPLGVGITGPAGWRTLGTATSATFPALASIPASGEATVWMPWTPNITLTEVDIQNSRFSHHSCVRVSAVPVSGEVIETNLDGDGEQENIDVFEVAAGRRPNGLQRRSFRLRNSGETTRTYTITIDEDLPADWTYRLNSPTKVTLGANQSQVITVDIVPSTNLPAGKTWELRVTASYMEQARYPAYVRNKRPHKELKRAGGVVFTAHAVDPTTITATVSVSGGRVRVAGALAPAVPTAHVAIDYPAGGKTTTRVVRTAADGSFRDDSVAAEGAMCVRAFWQGNVRQGSAATKLLAVGGASCQ